MVKIAYTISDDFLTVTPKHRQAAGVMGQAQACTVTFKVPLGVTYWHKRIEFVDTTGKLFTTDEEGYNELLKYENGEASVTLPWQWTVYGGTAFVRFVAYNVDADGNITEKVSTPDRALLFGNSKVGEDIVVRRSLAQLVVDGHATVKQTDELYEKVKEAYESGEFVGATPNLTFGNIISLPPNYSPTAAITGTKENPILNLGIPQGEKGDKPVKGYDYFTEADKAEMVQDVLDAVDIPESGDIIIDAALSLDSTNPVQNKVITSAINSAMFKGTDPVPSLADDTPNFWRNLGAGTWEITGAGQANIVDGGTFFIGTILNMPASSHVFQAVFAPITQKVFIRTAGVSNTWVSTWTPLTYSKQELVQGVLDALPTWEGGAY